MYFKRCEVVSRVEFFKSPIQEIIAQHSTIKKWAYILHDKDDRPPHYHIYLNFGKSGVDSKDIGAWFGLQESQVSKLKSKKETDVLLYLIHGNASQSQKHQYDPSEVVANFDYVNEIKNSEIIGDFEHYSYAEMLAYCNSLPVAEKVPVARQLDNLWKLQCKVLSLDSDRNIDVIFIYGKGGVGKTYYAKQLCKSRGYDYCLSSSSNDPFQDYLGQKCIILDDLRDRTFDNFEDFLKIIDNNNQSSVQSRFVNKVFNGDMIIVTSAVPLRYWYRRNGSLKDEDFWQLYRRFGCYVEITAERICVYTQLDERGNPCGDCKCYPNNLIQQELKDSSSNKTDFIGLFDNLFGSSFDPDDEIPF